jgi:uncharacterized small protein (DUF1192 family)
MYFGSDHEEEREFDSGDPVGQILLGILPAPEDQCEVLRQLRQEELMTVIHEDYQRAKESQCAERILAARVLGVEVIEDRLTTMQKRIERAEMCLEKEKAVWASNFVDFEESFQDTVASLKAHQADELQQFEQFWQTEPRATLPYSKASAGLQQMRSRQKRNAAVGDYEAAEACQYEADMMQLDEEVAGIQRAATGMMIEYRRIRNSHERQLECVIENGARHRALLESMRNRRLQDWEQAIVNYRNMLTEPYLARAKAHSRAEALIKNRDSTSVPASPRAPGMMRDYMETTNQGQLRLDKAAIVRYLHIQPQRTPVIPRTSKQSHGYRTSP